MEIWVANADGSHPVQLTNMHSEDTDTGHWSPSDDAITFITQDRGRREIFLVNASGGPAVPITNESGVSLEGGWTADGTGYYYTVIHSGNSEVWRVSRSGMLRVQMTHKGGFAGFETRSGTFYYWRHGAHNTATLWKRTSNEDLEVQLDPRGHFGGSTSVAGNGFYYRRAGTDAIYLYDEKSGRSRSVMDRKMPASFGDFTITPDGYWLATGVVVRDGRNLMLMQSFH